MAIFTQSALVANLSYKHVLLIAFVCFVVHVYVRRYVQARSIRRLGSTAPIIKTYAPFGMDFPFKACWYFLKNRAMEGWVDEFNKAGALETHNYTLEIRMFADIRVIMTADPENIKALLTQQFSDYGKGEQFHREWKDFLGDSIFTTDGTQWSASRALIRPMFQRERVADLDIIETHVQELFSLIGPGDGKCIDMQNLFFRFALDASTHFLFGQSAGSLINEQTEFALAFDLVQHKQALAGRAGPLRHFINMNDFYQGLKTMDRFIEPWITEALSLNKDELEGKLRKKDTFLHALARNTRDRKIIRDQLISLLLAGRDTTSATLSWLVLELARNPPVLEKLRAEIAQVVGLNGERPTYDNIKNMKYLTWMINETLRLYPVLPFNVRESLVDTVLPRGGGPDGTEPIGIPKGTPVGFSTLIMQRRRDLYPPISESFPFDPLNWVPERWATWQPRAFGGWTYIPFNGGPRICIGQQCR